MRYIFLVLVSTISFLSYTHNRSSSYPYVSGDTFRAFATHIIDETTQACTPDQIKKGDIVFVKTDYIPYFFSQIHPYIKDRYILLTHNSDYAVPGNFGHYLDDPKLFAWFGQNIDRTHPKLFCIPIGVANQYWPHGNIKAIAATQEKLLEKKFILYINYTASTSPERTDKGLERLTQLPGAYVPSRKPFEEYIEDLAYSIFVVSPPGNGLDCHRTWETLYMGGIPIVKRSSIADIFTDLPVLIVDNWAEITEQRLMDVEAQYKKSPLCMNKLYADYWFAILRNMQEACRAMIYPSLHK